MPTKCDNIRPNTKSFEKYIHSSIQHGIDIREHMDSRLNENPRLSSFTVTIQLYAYTYTPYQSQCKNTML